MDQPLRLIRVNDDTDQDVRMVTTIFSRAVCRGLKSHGFRVENRRKGVGDVENKIIIPLDGNKSFEEILLYATLITPRGDTGIAMLHRLPVGKG
jgi:hypothetical protein